MKENPKHIQAFDYYYKLQENRNIEAVAQEFGVSKKTAYKWSSEFNWKERCEQMDIEASKKLQAKAVDSVVNEKANYRKIVKGAIATFIKNLQSGKVQVNNVYELRELIKLDLLLMGEATDKTEVEAKLSQFNNLSDEEIDKAIEKLDK